MSDVEVAGRPRTLAAPVELEELVVRALSQLVAAARGERPSGAARYPWRFAGRPWAAPAAKRRQRPGLYRAP